MGDFKHLVLVKFKDGVVVEKLMEGMQNLVAEMDTVKSFEWYYRSLLLFSILVPKILSSFFLFFFSMIPMV